MSYQGDSTNNNVFIKHDKCLIVYVICMLDVISCYKDLYLQSFWGTGDATFGKYPNFSALHPAKVFSTMAQLFLLNSTMVKMICCNAT